MAVTKIAAASASAAGTLLNGLVRSAVHWPDVTSLSLTWAASSPRASSALWAGKVSASSPSTSMTTDCNTRRAPRLIADTVPAAGDV